jgi:hypothetical protein
MNQAVLLMRFPGTGDSKQARPGVRRIPPAMDRPGPMQAARFGHTMTRLSSDKELLLFGGLAAADAGKVPVAEIFSLPRMEFRPLPLRTGEPPADLPSRRGHVAVALRDNRVLIAGGEVIADGMARVEDSALIIEPAGPRVTLLPMFLSVPRTEAVAFIAGDEIVICGGRGPDRRPLPTCELFSLDGTRARAPVSMSAARAGLLALPLETDQVLLYGGTGENGALPAAVDLYTPLR